MTAPRIHGNRTPYSASNVLNALGRALHEIKAQDALTWADMGAILGKSDDQAAKYAEGTATMDVITFGRARREWNGRFTGYFDMLCEESRVGKVCDYSALTAVLDLANRLAVALENGEIEPEEVRENRKHLEAARDAIDAQLAKLGPAGEAA